MSHKDDILAYFQAFRDADRSMLEQLLVEDFRHVSPWAVYDHRDRMLDDIWPAVGQHWAEDIVIYGEGPDYLVRYKHTGGAAMVEHFRFDGGRIAEVEVIVGRGAPPAA